MSDTVRDDLDQPRPHPDGTVDDQGGEPRVAVIGTGYIGLPAALLLARAGVDVLAVDIDENIVSALNDGVLHLDEAQLADLLAHPQVHANMRASATPGPADVFIIAVPTPLDPRKKVADLTQVRDALRSIVPHLRPGNLVIIESTIPPGTCRNVATPLLEESGLVVGIDIHLAHCPERILPGDVFREIVHNDRIIGSSSEQGRALAVECYQQFVEGELVTTDDVTAELAKLVENTYRDVNIALANEVDAVADGLGIDGRAVIDLANRHPRVNLLRPGIGVGGHCIPIDPWFIKEVDPENARLVFTARLVNDERPHRVARRIRRAVADLTSPRIVVAGEAYKANTHDVRQSPAREVVRQLVADGYDVTVFDPRTRPADTSLRLGEVIDGADCLALLVPHDEFLDELRSARWPRDRATMRTPHVLTF